MKWQNYWATIFTFDVILNVERSASNSSIFPQEHPTLFILIFILKYAHFAITCGKTHINITVLRLDDTEGRNQMVYCRVVVSLSLWFTLWFLLVFRLTIWFKKHNLSIIKLNVIVAVTIFSPVFTIKKAQWMCIQRMYSQVNCAIKETTLETHFRIFFPYKAIAT